MSDEGTHGYPPCVCAYCKHLVRENDSYVREEDGILRHEHCALLWRGNEIDRLRADLAECYRLTGADPDGDEDWRLAEQAVTEVRRLRADLTALQEAYDALYSTLGKAQADLAAREQAETIVARAELKRFTDVAYARVEDLRALLARSHKAIFQLSGWFDDRTLLDDLDAALKEQP